MVFYINEIHSPDESVATLVKEMRLMDGMELFDVQNQIPKNIIEMMKTYKSFEHIKDMF